MLILSTSSLAVAIQSDMPCGELGGHITHGFPCGIVRGGHSIVDGVIEITDQPGFGVELDRNRLQQYVTSTTVVDTTNNM